MATCHFCGSETENPRLVFCDGREDVPTCSPPCDAALRPMPVARAPKSCTSCGADVTNQETYNGGDCFLCLPEDQKILVAGDPIIRWYLDHYLLAGRLEYFACFACGTAVEPKPVRATDTHGRERRCGGCGLEAALPLPVAVSEGWLHVMDAEGRVLNDTRQVGPA